MFWKILNIAVIFTFLLLALAVIASLYKTTVDIRSSESYYQDVKLLKADVEVVNQETKQELNSRLNLISSGQDSYQVNTSRRLDILEERLIKLEAKLQE